jgi:hypothetical protein
VHAPSPPSARVLPCCAGLSDDAVSPEVVAYCTATRAEALAKSGLYLSYIRLVKRLGGSAADSSGRYEHWMSAPWIRPACSTAAKLGAAAFAAECIIVDTAGMSPVTRCAFVRVQT